MTTGLNGLSRTLLILNLFVFDVFTGKCKLINQFESTIPHSHEQSGCLRSHLCRDWQQQHLDTALLPDWRDKWKSSNVNLHLNFSSSCPPNVRVTMPARKNRWEVRRECGSEDSEVCSVTKSQKEIHIYFSLLDSPEILITRRRKLRFVELVDMVKAWMFKSSQYRLHIAFATAPLS